MEHGSRHFASSVVVVIVLSWADDLSSSVCKSENHELSEEEGHVFIFSGANSNTITLRIDPSLTRSGMSGWRGGWYQQDSNSHPRSVILDELKKLSQETEVHPSSHKLHVFSTMCPVAGHIYLVVSVGLGSLPRTGNNMPRVVGNRIANKVNYRSRHICNKSAADKYCVHLLSRVYWPYWWPTYLPGFKRCIETYPATF